MQQPCPGRHRARCEVVATNNPQPESGGPMSIAIKALEQRELAVHTQPDPRVSYCGCLCVVIDNDH